MCQSDIKIHSKYVFIYKKHDSLDPKFVALAKGELKQMALLVQEKYPAINEKEVADWQEHLGQGIEGWVEEQFVQIGSANFVKTNAQNGVFIKVNAEIWGYFLLDNPFRKGFEQLIQFFKKSAELHLLSGDNDHQKEALVPYFNSDQQLHFYQSPKDKLTFVKQLQEKE